MLERAFDKLKPDGVVFVRVPNFGALNARLLGPRWCGILLPDHLNYFTNAQLRAMAEGAGYRYRLLNRFTLATDDNIKALLVRPAESKIDEGRVDLHREFCSNCLKREQDSAERSYAGDGRRGALGSRCQP